MSNYYELAESFKALGNPHRVSLLARLLDCCVPGEACCTAADSSRCVSELGEAMNIAPSTLSHHIKELHRAGLINVERDGRFIRCSVNVPRLSELKRFLGTATPVNRKKEGLT